MARTQGDERMRGASALQCHGVGLTLGPGRPLACARVGEEGLCLIAHGRLVCHPSTMAHVTSDACQGWPPPDPQGIPWPTSLSRHVDVTDATCVWTMVRVIPPDRTSHRYSAHKAVEEEK